MNKGIIIGGIVVLVGAASPYFCGSAIESKFDNQIKEFQVALKQMDPSLTLEKTEYSKGWFSSTAKTVLTVDREKIPLEHKITHGPFSYFGIGKIQTNIVFNDQQKQVVDSLFAGKQPILVTTNVGFSGVKSIELYSAEINNKPDPTDPSTTINWGGMTGNFNINGDRIITDVNVPKFSLTQTRKSVEILGLTIKGDSAYSNDKDKLAAINWAGNASLNIDKFLVQSPEGIYSSKIALNAVSTDDKANLGYNSTLKFTNIVVPQDLRITTADSDLVEFGIGFNGIPKKPFVDFLKKVDEIQQQGRTPSDSEVMRIGEPFVIAALQGTPSITAHALITSKQGDANINAEAKLATADTATDMMSLAMNAMNRLEITVTPSFSESLLDEVVNEGQLRINKDEFIMGITENNRFILNNGKFSGKFEFKQGQFYSNGQPDPELQQNIYYILPSGLF
ncbi:DUF945 family protein [Entomomonas asaccharolytica]|uniref:DUF945 family protein n=1 Tax=Entomomonas asaccharolytica TaxID=2785331 RepID=A0A974NGA2_9GAMM|nr:DUF945 family protein [Entomomonas asaccharolytica]QQP85959.1 DUF945 family protein [Entomomonas asaccharolytica]